MASASQPSRKVVISISIKFRFRRIKIVELFLAALGVGQAVFGFVVFIRFKPSVVRCHFEFLTS